MDSKVKLPITIILILILILVTIIFAIWPSILQIKKLSQAIYDQRIRLEKLYEQGQFLKKAREELKTTASQIEILNNLFILEGQELKFITALEEIASRNKLDQKIELDLSQQKELKANYKAVPIRLILKGEFLNTLKYLTEIERIDFYLNINSSHLESLIKISPGSQISPKEIPSSSEGEIQALISVESYWKH